MSNFVRCNEGVHQYDADRYSVCPYCRGYDKKTIGEKKSGEKKVVDKTKPIKAAIAKTSNLKVEQTDTAPINIQADENIQTAVNKNINATRVVRVGADTKPVTGWLAITKGPGKGTSHSVFHGVNTIGRDASQDVCFDFDDEVARENQARLTYDEKNNTFYIQHGDGTNLTYLNDTPVLEIKKLEAYDVISMGKIECIFVPFCNDKFTWENE